MVQAGLGEGRRFRRRAGSFQQASYLAADKNDQHADTGTFNPVTGVTKVEFFERGTEWLSMSKLDYPGSILSTHRGRIG